MSGFYELHDGAAKTVGVFRTLDDLIKALTPEQLSLFTKVFYVPMQLAFDGTAAGGVISVRGGPVEVPIEEILSAKEDR